MEQIKVGDRVKLVQQLPYLKTAEPMPMLRSGDILPSGARGVVLDRRPGGYYGIKFAEGAFLLEQKYLELVE